MLDWVPRQYNNPKNKGKDIFQNQRELRVNCCDIISIKVAAKWSVIFGCQTHWGGSKTWAKEKYCSLIQTNKCKGVLRSVLKMSILLHACYLSKSCCELRKYCSWKVKKKNKQKNKQTKKNLCAEMCSAGSRTFNVLAGFWIAGVDSVLVISIWVGGMIVKCYVHVCLCVCLSSQGGKG